MDKPEPPRHSSTGRRVLVHHAPNFDQHGEAEVPSQYTKKRARDLKKFALWDTRPEGDFTRHGLSREAAQKAQAQLTGTIVYPWDPAYVQDHKLFNPVFDDHHPQCIIYCMNWTDVGIALEMSRSSNFPAFTVRSGGHCTAGFSSGSGPLIDVSNLNDVCVEPKALRVKVGCGCNFGKLYEALSHYGLHVPAGECSDVCVGGFVQGGGYGFTSVTFGMNCDNVISMTVMLADGRIVEASESQNRDLWWAMRGGTGGNFGILLDVTYQLRPLGPCFGWAIAWPIATDSDRATAAQALLYLQQNYMGNRLPKELNIQVTLAYQPLGDPPDTPVPFLLLRGLYVGDKARGEQAIAPLQKLPGAKTQWTREDSFDSLNDMLLNYPASLPYFEGKVDMPCEDKVSRYVERELTLAEWRSLLDLYLTTPNPWSYAYLELYGGAIMSYPLAQSAFIHRRVRYNAVLDVFWFQESERGPAETFLQSWTRLISTFSNGEIYQNYPRLSEPDFASAYWGSAWPGLYQVKQKYDPQRVFQFAQAVPPPPQGAAALPAELREALAQPIQALFDSPAGAR